MEPSPGAQKAPKRALSVGWLVDFFFFFRPANIECQLELYKKEKTKRKRSGTLLVAFHCASHVQINNYSLSVHIWSLLAV